MSKAFLLPAKLGLMIARHMPGCTTERDGHTVLPYETAHRVVAAAYKAVGRRVNAYGAEQIQPGPGWVIARHSSGLDITDISMELYNITGEKPYFVAKNTLVENPWGHAQYSELGAKFIDRKKPSAKSMREIIDTVRDGNLMVIFPEGTRNKGVMGEFNPGAAMMAYMLSQKYGLDAPIYCIGVVRSRYTTNLNIAPPMKIEDFGGIAERKADKKKIITEMTAEMHEAVGRLSRFKKKHQGASLEMILKQQNLLTLSGY